ncbi:hypothetical protein L484_008177 [Morus notabilis]|uniref:Uncharacterized protein n=1 Tax=Morus notabilis TaxID=981085 RepID=W9S5U8_9ROSA|nr:hypothetical protein L484_008177 [Morus notabilis]
MLGIDATSDGACHRTKRDLRDFKRRRLTISGEVPFMILVVHGSPTGEASCSSVPSPVATSMSARTSDSGRSAIFSGRNLEPVQQSAHQLCKPDLVAPL